MCLERRLRSPGSVAALRRSVSVPFNWPSKSQGGDASIIYARWIGGGWVSTLRARGKNMRRRVAFGKIGAAALPSAASLVEPDADATTMRALQGHLPGTMAGSTSREANRPSTIAKLTDVPESSNASADTAMDRYADGDDRAFDEVYDAMAQRLYSYAVWLTRNEQRAEDLLQHTWEMICRNRGRFVRGSRVMPWAIAILRNRHRDAAKRPAIEQALTERVHDSAESVDRPDPAECVEQKQLDECVRLQIRRLPPCQRDALELFYYGGLSQIEVAEVLDASVASVKSRLQRATENLRSIFRCSDRMEEHDETSRR